MQQAGAPRVIKCQVIKCCSTQEDTQARECERMPRKGSSSDCADGRKRSVKHGDAFLLVSLAGWAGWSHGTLPPAGRGVVSSCRGLLAQGGIPFFGSTFPKQSRSNNTYSCAEENVRLPASLKSPRPPRRPPPPLPWLARSSPSASIALGSCSWASFTLNTPSSCK